MKIAASGGPFYMFLEMRLFSGNQLLSELCCPRDFTAIARWSTALIRRPQSRRGRSRAPGSYITQPRSPAGCPVRSG